MHPVALLAVLASAAGLFTALPVAFRGGPVLGTVVPMVIAIAFAVAASGRPNALAVASGAIIALLATLAWRWFPYVSGAVAVGLAYAERSTRVRQVRARIIHVSIAVVAGAAGGALAASYADASPTYRTVALLMAAVVALAPALVPADDPRVQLLERAVRRVGPGKIGATLLDGIELLRLDTALLDRETSTNVRKSWR